MNTEFCGRLFFAIKALFCLSLAIFLAACETLTTSEEMQAFEKFRALKDSPDRTEASEAALRALYSVNERMLKKGGGLAIDKITQLLGEPDSTEEYKMGSHARVELRYGVFDTGVGESGGIAHCIIVVTENDRFVVATSERAAYDMKIDPNTIIIKLQGLEVPLKGK